MYSEYSVLITQWTMVHGTELTSDIPTIKPFMAINNSLLPCIVHNRYSVLIQGTQTEKTPSVLYPYPYTVRSWVPKLGGGV